MRPERRSSKSPASSSEAGSGPSAENIPGAVTKPCAPGRGRACSSQVAKAAGGCPGRVNQNSLPWALDRVPSSGTSALTAFRTESIPSVFCPSTITGPPGATARTARPISPSVCALLRAMATSAAAWRPWSGDSAPYPAAASAAWVGASSLRASVRAAGSAARASGAGAFSTRNRPASGKAGPCPSRAISRRERLMAGSGGRGPYSRSIRHCRGCSLRRASSITWATLVSAIS